MTLTDLNASQVDEPEHIDEFCLLYRTAIEARHGHGDARDLPSMGLIMFVESTRSLMRLPEICARATEALKKTNLVPECLVFGGDDFVADVGATRTKEARELLYARQKMVTVRQLIESLTHSLPTPKGSSFLSQTILKDYKKTIGILN